MGASKYNLNKSNRILVMGCSGGGKSTIARVLAKRLNLPLIHLDIHFWKPHWIETSKEEWRKKVAELVKGEKWIMDGTFSESFDLRFPVADRIIIVDRSRLLCLWRAITRVIKHNRKKLRPDIPEGCTEEFNLEFYKYIWDFKNKVTPLIEDAIKKYDCESKVIWVKSQKDIEDLLLI